MSDQRGRLLAAALGFAGCSMPSHDRALHALCIWLDSWSGIGRVAVGMHRQGFDLQLTQYDERGWRATFYTTGDGALTHERDGHRVGADAVHAAQSAARDALRRAERTRWRLRPARAALQSRASSSRHGRKTPSCFS
jgi:hypothetical protein